VDHVPHYFTEFCENQFSIVVRYCCQKQTN